MRWSLAYVGALAAYEDSENKRAATARCIERVNAPPRRWWMLAR